MRDEVHTLLEELALAGKLPCKGRQKEFRPLVERGLARFNRSKSSVEALPAGLFAAAMSRRGDKE